MDSDISTMAVRPEGWTLTVGDDEAVPVAEVSQEQEIIRVRSWSATKADLDWRHTDSNGHKHRWKQDGENSLGKPRYRVTKAVDSLEHIPCDGSCGNWDCDGYDIPVWHCSKCGEKVKPAFVPDWEAQTVGTAIPGMQSMKVTTADVSQSMLNGRTWMPAELREPDGTVQRGEVYVMKCNTGSRGSKATLDWRPARG